MYLKFCYFCSEETTAIVSPLQIKRKKTADKHRLRFHQGKQLQMFVQIFRGKCTQFFLMRSYIKQISTLIDIFIFKRNFCYIKLIYTELKTVMIFVCYRLLTILLFDTHLSRQLFKQLIIFCCVIRSISVSTLLEKLLCLESELNLFSF